MRAELSLRWPGVSNRAAERAEVVGKRRCGSAGVAVRGPCVPAVGLNSNSPCGNGAAHHLGRLAQNAGQSERQVLGTATVRGQLQDYVLVRRASRFSGATLKADSDGVRADRAGD